MPVLQLTTDIDQGIDAFGTGGDRKNPKPVESKARPVNRLHPCRLICQQFAVEGRLNEARTLDGHRSAVGFEEEKGEVALGTLVSNVQCEYTVGDDSKFQAPVDIHSPPKRSWQWVVACPNRNFRTGEKPNIAGLPAGEFNPDHHIGNQKCMLKKYSADRPVLLAPTDLAKSRVKFLSEECRSLAPQAMYDVP